MTTILDNPLHRTHNCGALRSDDIGQTVQLCGWVRSYRDHGGVVFIDLRDREGVTQVLFDPSDNTAIHDLARSLRNEWVVSISGKVRSRPDGMHNPKLPTGDIEIVGQRLIVLNKADTVPFDPDTTEKVAEETRLKYRYVDLRRPEMSQALIWRHRISKTLRDYYDRHGFIEVETPFLTKSTPEGARDFLVPSRTQPGSFYALPQSPQLFKQILMCGGMDKYYQLVRCFRDEDLRADRQPEFTQLDVEMSFVTREDVMAINEGALREVAALCNVAFPEVVPIVSYQDAVRDYGIDRPDMRFEMKLQDITDLAKTTDFKVFKLVAESGGIIKGLTAKGGEKFTRKQLDELTQFSMDLGAQGMAWTKVDATGQLNGPISKFFAGDKQAALISAMKAQPGDCMMFIADRPATVNKVLAALRSKLGKDMGLYTNKDWKWCWVIDFPLLDWDQDENRWVACHHPFTSPMDQDMPLLETDPGKVRAKAYDLILNGTELGGGSIRNHTMELQEKVFRVLGIDQQNARLKFGFLLDALRFGAPPHGGIAFGLDRIVMLMLNRSNLREVIAFPKTASGSCPMSEAPSPVDDRQLAELDIKVIEKPKK